MKKSAVWLREDFVNFEWVVICSHFCRSEMIRETTSTHFLTVKKKTCTFHICCGSNWSLVEYFSVKFDFLFQTDWKKNKKNSNHKIHGLHYALNIKWTADDIKTLWFILIWAKWVCFTVLPYAERWYIKINVVRIPFKFIKLVYFDVIFQKMNAQRK